MMKKILPVLILIASFSGFVSCKKSDNTTSTPTPTPSTPTQSRTVKYELTGSYTGTLIVGYTNQDGTNQLVDKLKLPWTIEVTVKGSGFTPVALTAGSEVGGYGKAGETLTGKLYVGGVEKKSATVNSTSTGYIDLPAQAYQLQ